MGGTARSRGTAPRVVELPGAAPAGRGDVQVIGRLRGTLAAKQPPWLLIDVGGVGYELEAPMSTFYELPETGGEVTLFTHHAQKEDSVSLYGFLMEEERRLFRDVQKVTGIGARVALAILSGVTVNDFARIVTGGDVTALTRIPGVGKKTAERILLELRDRKIAGGDVAVMRGGHLPTDALGEATIALQQLGYKPVEAQRMAQSARGEGDNVEAIIRKALKAALR